MKQIPKEKLDEISKKLKVTEKKFLKAHNFKGTVYEASVKPKKKRG